MGTGGRRARGGAGGLRTGVHAQVRSLFSLCERVERAAVDRAQANAPWQKQLLLLFSASRASNALSSLAISNSSLAASSDNSSSGSGSSFPLPLPFPLACAAPFGPCADAGATRTWIPPATGARGTLGAREAAAPAGRSPVRGLTYARGAPGGAPNGLEGRELAGVLAQDEVPLAGPPGPGPGAAEAENGAEGKR